jgi:TldD protein
VGAVASVRAGLSLASPIGCHIPDQLVYIAPALTDELTLPAARSLAHQALDALRPARDVRYADVRFVEETREIIRVRNGVVENASRKTTSGFGVRVLAAGAWGFATASSSREDAVIAAAHRAREVALASAAASVAQVKWREGPARTGTYRTPTGDDPVAVPLDRKIADLLAPVAALRHGEGGIRVAESRGDFARRRQLLVSTEGTDVAQTFFYTGAGLTVYAMGDDGETQRRSYPSAIDGDHGQGGYERVAAMRLVEEAPRVRQEAIELLRAPILPAGKRDIILESSQLALQVHESCGHPVELDRALGTEVSLAGGSFLQPAMTGRFAYGSKIVNLTADGTSPGGLGTFAFDDEGTPASRVPIVKDGTFVGWLSSRETAAELGIEPSGAMRAETHARIPLIRMVNVNLEPGRGSMADLLADSDGALLFETNKSWSIDDLRLHFQFGCEVAWEIKGGRKVQMYRDPVYAGTTPKFWGGCDAITGPEEWKLWGLGNCGKGEPMQLMRVGHGASPSRFRGVEVGRG